MPKTQITAGIAFTYLDSLGRASESGPAFRHPYGVARGQGDAIYVVNRSDEFNQTVRITKCTLNHEWIMDIGKTGTEDGQFLWPAGITLDSRENIYVSDQSAQKIVMFESNGTFLGKWGIKGSDDGELDTPSGIGIDKEDNLYVVDTGNSRVQKLTKDGNFLAKFGSYGSGQGQFSMPWGIDIGPDGDVYVADWGNDRVQKFSPDGEFLAAFGRSGTGKGELSRPSDVAVDRDGVVYVADWGNNRVQGFEANGDYLVTLHGDATELSPWAKMFVEANPDIARARARANLEPERRLRRPVSVIVGDDYKIVIVEDQNGRLQIYQKDPDYRDAEFNL